MLSFGRLGLVNYKQHTRLYAQADYYNHFACRAHDDCGILGYEYARPRRNGHNFFTDGLVLVGYCRNVFTYGGNCGVYYKGQSFRKTATA